MSKFRKQHMAIEWHELVNEDTVRPATEATLKEKSTIVGRTGLLMLSAGTGAWRVRAAMNKMARALGIVCNADIGLLAIEYTCIDGEETYTNAISINTTGVNTDKLTYIKDFSDGFKDRAGRYSVEQIHRILDKIEKMPSNYKPIQISLAAALACCAFTFLLGGGPIEMLVAFVGAGVGQFVRKMLIDKKITLLANVTAAVASACFTYMALIKLIELVFGVPSVHQSGYICSMLFIIPGFPLITGFLDIAKLDMRSGIERLAYAFLIIGMATLTGWVAAEMFDFRPESFTEMQIQPAVLFGLRLVASFFAVYGFSFLFNSPQRMALIAAVIGMVANTLRLELVDIIGIPASVGAFIGALTAGLLASAIRSYAGYPRISLTVPSIVIMVPGMFMYKAIYFIGQSDISTGGLWLTKALLIVTALPLGLVFARIFTDNNFRKSS